jgi:hypothetical protein
MSAAWPSCAACKPLGRGAAHRCGRHAGRRLCRAGAGLARARAVFAARFAGLPVRNSGTLGGNVANGSPIGDSMPLLIALRARLVLASVRGERRDGGGRLLHRLPARTSWPADEVLAFIDVPLPPPAPGGGCAPTRSPSATTTTYPPCAWPLPCGCRAIVGRRDLHRCGGVAATPVRARMTEAALRDQPWTRQTLEQAIKTLRESLSRSPTCALRPPIGVRCWAICCERLWLQTQGATTRSTWNRCSQEPWHERAVLGRSAGDLRAGSRQLTCPRKRARAGAGLAPRMWTTWPSSKARFTRRR